MQKHLGVQEKLIMKAVSLSPSTIMTLKTETQVTVFVPFMATLD